MRSAIGTVVTYVDIKEEAPAIKNWFSRTLALGADEDAFYGKHPA